LELVLLILRNSVSGETIHQQWYQILPMLPLEEKVLPAKLIKLGRIHTLIQKYKKEVLKLLKLENFQVLLPPLMLLLNTLEIGL
jgi:hypothetical protein